MTTENSRYLPRFQSLCERYGLKPTYLVDWEMSQCPVFREFGRSVLSAGVGEIGMHLHAWNSPPAVNLTSDDSACQPYLAEYPLRDMREKIVAMTDTLEETFGVKMLSHRGGRWSFSEGYARILLELGYQVDCSVTPNVSWRRNCDGANGRGGNDYRGFPTGAYMVDLDDIGRPLPLPARGPCLLEVPMTIMTPRQTPLLKAVDRVLRRALRGSRVIDMFFGTPRWLRPRGDNGQSLLDIVEDARREGRDYVEFMLHSSEFMPGGSPTFPTSQSIERLYEDLDTLFAVASGSFQGCTLSEYAKKFLARAGATQRKSEKASISRH